MQELCGTVSGPGVVRVWLLVLCCLALPGPHVAEQDPITPPGLQATLAAQKSLFSSLHDLTKMEGATRTVHRVMEHYVELPSFIANALNLSPVLSFIASSPSETDPLLKDLMQIVDKIDSTLDGVSLLGNISFNYFWTKYAELCRDHEINIRESWKLLKDFLVRGPTAKTMEGKSRLAGKFKTFFTQSKTENSVAMMHQYVVANTGSSQNMPMRFSDDTQRDFYRVSSFCSYLSGLLVLGQQMKIYCHLLADRSGAASAEEGMRLFSNMHVATLRVLDLTMLLFLEEGANPDAYYIAKDSSAESSPTAIAESAAMHFNEKYNWLKWTAVVVDSKSGPPEHFNITFPIGSKYLLCIKYAPLDTPVNTTLSCSADQCHPPSGMCKEWEEAVLHYCKCAKNFYGPNCSRNIQQDIEESRLMSWDNPIIVPDLTSIYYSIMELKNLLKKSQY